MIAETQEHIGRTLIVMMELLGTWMTGWCRVRMRSLVLSGGCGQLDTGHGSGRGRWMMIERWKRVEEWKVST